MASCAVSLHGKCLRQLLFGVREWDILHIHNHRYSRLW